eukprot:COSAG04_NODE_1352_length_7118_cov_26.021228_6_plen_308_part_01
MRCSQVRDVCVAGLPALVERTASWLSLAADYQLQTAEANAGVIATQLCLETRYETLTCLSSAPGWPGSMSTPSSEADAASAAALADLHSQACAMAESIGKGHSTAMLLSTTDVGALRFSAYHQTFTTVQSYINTLQQSYGTLSVRSDFHTSLAQEVALGSADAADEADIFQAKVKAADSRMEVYRRQIQGIDTIIQQTLQSMQLDGPALIEAVTNQIASSKDSFQRAASAGGGALQPEERSALQAQAADLQAQQEDIQRRLDGLGRRLQAGDDDRPQLEHRLGTVTQLLSWVQQRLSDADRAPAPSNP